jgi:hypothetical protein
MVCGSGTEETRRWEFGGINVWMIVALAAIVLAVLAGALAFRYKQQIDDWEAAAAETTSALQEAGVQLQGTVESGVAGYEQQISNLSRALVLAGVHAGSAATSQSQVEQDLADTQAELQQTQQDLENMQQDLKKTQAKLDDANTKLEQLGKLRLADGTYVGPVLGARTAPIPGIIFQDGTAWRVAEVAPDARITSGGQTLTLEQFSELLQSTDPTDVNLVNGNYKVKVEGGLVTSMQKSKE